MGKRLSRLSETCSRALTVASVIGRDFRLDVLQKVLVETTPSQKERGLGGEADEELAKALEEARGTAVIEETRQGGIGGVSYRFTHAFFRQTLYEEIIAPRRIRLHQQVARALEEVHRRRLDEHAAELAEHFSYSSDPDDLARAVQYGEAAARRAMGVYAYGEAVRHLERCLQVQEVLDPDDQAKRCDLFLAWGEALILAGEARKAAELAAEEAFKLGDASRDKEAAIRACRIGIDGLGRLVVYAEPAFLRWCQRLDKLAAPGTIERAEADWAMGRRLNIENRRKESRQLIQQAYALASKLDDPRVLLAVGRDTLLALNAPAHHQDRVRRAYELMGRAWPTSSARHMAVLLGFSAGAFLAAGDRPRAEDNWRQIAALAERGRDPTAIGYSLNSAFIVALLDGRLEEAAAVKDIALSSPLDIVAGYGRALSAVGARALGYQGRYREALAQWPQGITGGSAGAWRGSLLAQAGQKDEAKAWLRARTAVLQKDLEDGEAAQFDLGGLLEAAAQVEDREAVFRLIVHLRPMHDACAAFAGNIHAGYIPARLLGDATLLLGDHAQARKDYQAAVDLGQKIRFRPEVALARLGLAEVLLDHYPAERSEAVKHLDAAIAEFRDMKMQPSLERALKRKEILKA